MALDTRSRGRWWSRLHFLVRFVGLTGLMVGAVGLALALLDGLLTVEVLQRSWELIQAQAQGQATGALPELAIASLAGGLVAGAFALLVEIILILRLAAGRRSAVGFNALVQTVLAAALFIGVNVYAFEHYLRFDWTWGGKFTVNPEIQAKLRNLSRDKGKTIIVAYRLHKSASGASSQNDAYEKEAEAKVVEKVKDLVEQFRELGPQFAVVDLDASDKQDDDKIKRILAAEETPAATEAKDVYRNKPRGFYEKFNPLPAELKEAIEEAPENSIFFYADKKVQRLSFDDLYQLDKVASVRAGNLVLLSQGIEPFARRVLNIDQKRPKIGILTIHEYLSTEGPDELGLRGVKKALTEHGFDVQDIILKRENRLARDLEPAVYTFDEYKFEKLDSQLAALDRDIKQYEKAVDVLTKQMKRLSEARLQDLKRDDDKAATEEDRRRTLAFLRLQMQAVTQDLQELREEHKMTAANKAGLDTESISEALRMTDLKAKLTRQLADCDLVIVPRLTVMDLATGWAFSSRLFKLDKAQTDALRAYLRSGKPLLACFGPDSEPPDRGMRPPTGPDDLERMLAELGVRLDARTVVFDTEAKKFEELRSGQLVASTAADVPPVLFDWPANAFRPSSDKIAAMEPDHRTVNPIRRSMQIATRGVGEGLDLSPHHPRPVLVDPAWAKKLPFDPVFMATQRKSWGEDNPFPTREKTPRYEESKQRGPIPIGAALEAEVPASWASDGSSKAVTVRVAVIGDARMFVARELSPAKERLFLNTCNWLLGRDDLLAKDDHPWSYPRVALTPRAHEIWKWGAWVGLPMLFAYLGLVVLLVRRLR